MEVKNFGLFYYKTIACKNVENCLLRYLRGNRHKVAILRIWILGLF